jgi:hypothetical protein
MLYITGGFATDMCGKAGLNDEKNYPALPLQGGIFKGVNK